MEMRRKPITKDLSAKKLTIAETFALLNESFRFIIKKNSREAHFPAQEKIYFFWHSHCILEGRMRLNGAGK